MAPPAVTARPHVVDHGGAGRSVLLLHGLGGSHAGWMQVGPLLARHARVRALDLPGFGLSPRTGRSDVPSSADVVERLLDEDGPAVLVGSSMGAVVSLLVAVERPELVEGLVWVNPGLPRHQRIPLDPAVTAIFRAPLVGGHPAVRARWERMGPDGAVDQTLALCTVDPSTVAPEVRRAMVETRAHTFARPDSARAYTEAVRSLSWILGRRGAHRRLVRRVAAPTLVLHGTEDRLVPVDSARRLVRTRPDWQLVELDDIGHLPQVETPATVAGIITRWLTEGAGSTGRRTGRPADA